MNQQLAFNQLRQLSLSGFAKALRLQIEQPANYDELPFVERLELLLQHELEQRLQRKQQRLIRRANFKLKASFGEVDYQHQRNLKKSQLVELAQCDWLMQRHNLLVTGPCGSGKTYLACALGHQACMLGYSVRYYRLSRLLLELHQAKADGSYPQKLKSLANLQLLILDDFGLQPLNAAERHDLIEIFDDRYLMRSSAILSQLPADQWYATIGDNTLADAILDRMMHNAHRIALSGASMRRKQPKNLSA